MHRLDVTKTGMILALTMSGALVSPAVAQVPGTLLVEGVLHSGGGGPAADGSYVATFSIYDKQANGNKLWTEGPVAFKVSSGRFSVVIGATKPISGKALAAPAWLGIKIGNDPELPTSALHASAFALRAGWANALDCKGCVAAQQLGKGSVGANAVGFSYAAAADGAKGGDAVAARALKCTGCVTVAHMKFDKDVDLGANALKVGKLTSAGDVVAGGLVAAKQFVGDGSKLTGIKTPSGACKGDGEVVKGINPDGSLQCIKSMDPSLLPKDGIAAISNGLLANQFDDDIGSKNTPVHIPDNNPNGTTDEIDFPDIGIAQDFKVKLDLQKSSDVQNLRVYLFPPHAPNLPAGFNTLVVNESTGALKPGYPHYLLHNKTKGPGGVTDRIQTSYPDKTKPASGDLLKDWVGKNPKGKWRMVLVDSLFKDNKIDGVVVSWSIELRTLSNKKLQVKGDMYVNNNLFVKKNAEIDGSLTVKGGGSIKGNIVNTDPVRGDARNYTVVMVLDNEHSATNKVCPDGFQFLKSYDWRANDGDVMVGIGANGSLVVGSQNSWGYGSDYLAYRYEWSHSRSICYRTYTAPRGKPFVSVLGAYPITSAAQCPSGYNFVSVNDCNGTNNDYCHVAHNRNGLFIGNADSYAQGYASDSAAKSHFAAGRSSYGHTRGVCWRLYGVEGTPEETHNGMFTMAFGMHPNNSCPAGFEVRRTNDIDRNDNWFYSSHGDFGHFFGGWNSYWHGGSRFYQSWRQDYVQWYCWRYLPITAKTSYEVLMARYKSSTNTCPKGFLSINGDDIQGWNNNGYMQAGSHSFYLGGLNSWSHADLKEGYMLPHSTSHWDSARLCIKINGVKWPY